MRRVIAQAWAGYEREVIPASAPAIQRQESRLAFYAGAATLFGSIMSLLEPGKEATQADLDAMTAISNELTEHLAEVRARAAQRRASAPSGVIPSKAPGGSRAIPEAHYYEVPEGLNVASWSPGPPGGGAPSTQVHLQFGSPPGNVWVARFKSSRIVDELIAALVEHREDVWEAMNEAEWEQLRWQTLDQMVTTVKLHGSAAAVDGFTKPEGWPYVIVVAVAKPGNERAVELAQEFSSKLTKLAPVKNADRNQEDPFKREFERTKERCAQLAELSGAEASGVAYAIRALRYVP